MVYMALRRAVFPVRITWAKDSIHCRDAAAGQDKNVEDYRPDYSYGAEIMPAVESNRYHTFTKDNRATIQALQRTIPLLI